MRASSLSLREVTSVLEDGDMVFINYMTDQDNGMGGDIMVG